MKVLLTGATGFLGWRTLEALVADPRVETIIANGRSLKEPHILKHEKITYVLGTLENMDFVRDLVRNVNYIIHAAAFSSPWGEKEQFERANVHTQQNLIRAAIEFDIKNYVFISTPSLYFEFKNKLNIKETDPLPKKFVNAYAETKRKAEILLIQSGVPYVMLRPRAIIGRGDTVIMPRLIRAYDEGRLKIIGNGKNVVDLTAVENVTDAILLSLIAKDEAINQTYNITNGAPVLLWDAITDILKKLGKKPPVKKIPFKLIKTIATLLELKSNLTDKKEPVLTKYGVGTLAMSLTMDISKAKDLLGYEPKTTIEEAIEEFVNWYQLNEKL